MNKFIWLEFTMYADVLALLQGKRPNIKDELSNTVAQGDPCLDDIRDALKEIAEYLELDESKVLDIYDNDSLSHLMNYINIDETKIDYNYDETAAQGECGIVAFKVPFNFNLVTYIDFIKQKLTAPDLRKVDIALLEKPGYEGLSKTEVSYLYDMLSMPEAYPVEIGDINGSSTAMGFITPKAAEKLQYEYGQESELGRFISSVLDDMDKEPGDGIYEFANLRIWMNRNIED